MYCQRHRGAARGGVHRSGGRVAVDQRSRFGGHLAIVERPLFVLGLGPAQGRLQGHDPLPFGGETALLAVAVAKLAVALVTFEADLQAMVAAAGTVGRGPRVQCVTTGRSVSVPPAFIPRFGHRLHPTILRNHQPYRDKSSVFWTNSLSLAPALILYLYLWSESGLRFSNLKGGKTTTTTMLTELQSSGSARQGFSIAGEKLTEYRTLYSSARYCRDQVSQRDNAPNTLFGDDAFRKHLLRLLLPGRCHRGAKVNRPLGSAKIATLFSTDKHTHGGGSHAMD